MNHYSGGNRCLAEICRVNPAAADDRKVRTGEGSALEGSAIIEAQPSEDCGRARHRRSSVPETGNAMKAVVPKKKSASGYDPLAPERVRQIIAGLDQLYPE